MGSTAINISIVMPAYNEELNIRSATLQNMETFSALVTVKWFMIWFTQSVAWSEILFLWDFLRGIFGVFKEIMSSGIGVVYIYIVG